MQRDQADQMVERMSIRLAQLSGRETYVVPLN
jgi:hypothetical protein